MPRNSIVHTGQTQTIPDIFVKHAYMPVDWHSASSFVQWTLCATYAGECNWNIEGVEFITKQGDFLVTRPHVAISWRNLPEPFPTRRDQLRIDATDRVWECCYAVFLPRPNWSAWLDTLNFREGFAVMHFEGSAWESITAELFGLTSAFEQGGFLRDEWSLNALERVLLTLYSQSAGTQNASDRRVQDAVDFIHTAYAEPVAIADIALAAGLSVSRVSALFVNALGCAPAQYLESVFGSPAPQRCCSSAP